MSDTARTWEELNDTELEIFDIPELQTQEKFDFKSYIEGDTDYA